MSFEDSELYTFPARKGWRGLKAQIVAHRAGQALPVVGEFDVPSAKTPEYIESVNPLGKVPALKTPEGILIESNSIMKYVARKCASDLYPTSVSKDKKACEAVSKVDMLIDWFLTEIDLGSRQYRRALFGLSPILKEEAEQLKKLLMEKLGLLNQHLEGKSWLTGGAISLADVAGFCLILTYMEKSLVESDRAQIPNVMKWFQSCLAEKGFEIVGEVTYCVKEKYRELEIKKPKPAAKDDKAGKSGGSKKQKPKAGGDSKGTKKETLLGVNYAKEEDFARWYQDLVVNAELIEYYDVSGCYILRPWAYAIWEEVKDFLDCEIKKNGVENTYFPLFVSERALTAEEEHLEGFAPEVAWVTKSGNSPLENPIAIRPTSETIMYPVFAKWIQSHRDLPLKVNQWCNVVRWEFKHPTPFIRSREFLWQEGHTAYASKAEADEEALHYLEIYRRAYEEVLAVPVIKGVKSEKEKFAGADYTTTVEAFIPSTGRGVQGGTSHCLGQNFSKMFNIVFENEHGESQMVYQNSFGMTTRTIGVMIMLHGDNKGLVLPPKAAPLQIVIIPIPMKGKTDVFEPVKLVADSIRQLPGIKVKTDIRENYTPGWKYNHYELKGVPLRCEIGPRDADKRQAVFVRRDTGEKIFVAWDDIPTEVPRILDNIQTGMLERARQEMQDSIAHITAWKEFTPALDSKKMAMGPWCEKVECEEWIKVRCASIV